MCKIDLPENQDDDNHDNHDRADNHDKVQDLSFKSRHASLGLIRQLCDPAKDGAISSGNNHTSASS